MCKDDLELPVVCQFNCPSRSHHNLCVLELLYYSKEVQYKHRINTSFSVLSRWSLQNSVSNSTISDNSVSDLARSAVTLFICNINSFFLSLQILFSCFQDSEIDLASISHLWHFFCFCFSLFPATLIKLVTRMLWNVEIT